MNSDVLVQKSVPASINWEDPKLIAALKATVAQGADEQEFLIFSRICQSTGLNPLLKEIWFIKTKGYTNKYGKEVPGKMQIMTGIQGYYTIANTIPEYDGIDIEHVEKDGKLVECVAKVYRKDRSYPSVGRARWLEYFPGKTDKGNSLWETKPYTMLSKVAESIALRKAFPNKLNGLYTQEEMPAEYSLSAIGSSSEESDEPKATKPSPLAIEAVCRTFIELGVSETQLNTFLGKSKEEVTHMDIAKLRDVYKAVKTKKKTLGEYFPGEPEGQVVDVESEEVRHEA